MADPLMCTACFGPIHSFPVYVNGLPYHSQQATKGVTRSSLCSPPPPVPKDPKPIPGQLDITGKVVT